MIILIQEHLTKVKNINFVGNKIFSDGELKTKISTKEDAWYKIFGSNKFIPERLEYDKEKLKNFYNERGYIDFKVEIARGDLLPDLSGFNLNFIIYEGPRYIVNNINIKTELINTPNISLIDNLFKDLIDVKSSLLLNELPSKKESSLLITLSFVLVLPEIIILLIYFSSPFVIKKLKLTNSFTLSIEDVTLTKL